MTNSIAFLMCLVALCGGCHGRSHPGKAEQITISREHGICTAVSGGVSTSEEMAIDYEYGLITAGDGVSVRYYVSSEPGRIGSGRLVTSTLLNERTSEGKPIYKDIFSDGLSSLRVNGFPSELDGKPKVLVKLFFSKDQKKELALAMKLAKAAAPCN